MKEEPYIVSSVSAHPPAVYVKIFAPDGENIKLGFTEKIWERWGYNRGDEISESVFFDMKSESEKCKAVTKALSFITASNPSINGLKRKLKLAGFSDEATCYAVDTVVQKGLVDEFEQALRIAENEATRKRRGPMRIKRELMAKGYGSEISQRAVKSVPAGVYREALSSGLAKRCPDGLPADGGERRKLMASLVRQGFSMSEIIRMIDEKE